jgi:hypothetical protein
VVFGAVALLACSRLQGPAGVSANASQPLVDPEIRRATDRGSTRVLVEVRLPQALRPEGELTRADAIAAQRTAISTAQQSVLSRLPHSHFSLVRRYDTTPFLALEIDRDALTALERMGDVVARVLPDRIMAPAGPR